MESIKLLEELNRNSLLNHRYISEGLDINNSYLSQILKRKRTLSPKMERNINNFSYTKIDESENYIVTLSVQFKK